MGWRAHNVTLPGGLPMTQAVLENRQEACNAGRRFQGIVHVWDEDGHFGFIKVDQCQRLPTHVESRMMQRIARMAVSSDKTSFSTEEKKQLLYFRGADVNAGEAVV